MGRGRSWIAYLGVGFRAAVCLWCFWRYGQRCITSIFRVPPPPGAVQQRDRIALLLDAGQPECVLNVAELQSLNLSGNSIVCKGALDLCQELLQNVPLCSLNLANNSLTDRAGVAVAGLLLPSSACSCSHLQLSGNCSLSISTAAKLAQVLPYATALKSLDLSRTQLSAHLLPSY